MKSFFSKAVPFIYLVAGVFNLVSAAKSQPALLTNGLVAFYPFNGDPNDATGNQHNGILNGGGISYTEDRYGSNNASAHFTGGGHINIAPTPFNVNADYTVSFWTKLDPNADYVDNFLSTGGDNQGGFDIRVVPNTSAGWAFIAMGPNGIDSDPPTTYTDWHSIVSVHQGKNDFLYIDSVLMAQGNNTGTALDTGSLWLGQHQNPSFTYDLTGDMDDLRIYNLAFDSNEVAELYAFETAGLERAAMATVQTVNGFVVGATLTDAGTGYTNTPQVRLIGGGGSGAVATAVVSNGVVVSIMIDAAGSNYATLPLVVISPPVIPNPTLAISQMSSLVFSNLAVGSNYQFQILGSNFWVSRPGIITPTMPIYTQLFPGPVDPTKYRLALSPAPAQAFASPQLDNGFVVGAYIGTGGFGYVSPPAVTIVGGSGSNATAFTQIGGGMVTNIVITDAGINYSAAAPTIQIAPPPAGPGILPTIQSAVLINEAKLSTYDNYQLQVSQDFTAGWSNLAGGSFSPTNATNSQLVFITNSVGFFRLQHLP